MRLLVTGRLQDGAFALRLLPLCELPEVDEIEVVRDRPGPPLPRVRYRTPPRGLGPLRHAARTLRLATAALRRRPDAVLGVFLVPHGLAAVAAAALARRPAVVSILGSDLHVHLASRLRRRLLLPWLRRAAAVTVTGSRSAARLAALGVPAARLVELPNAVDVGRFAVPPAAERDLDLVFAGRLAPGKRPLLFLDLCARLRERRGRVRAAVLGDGPLAGAVAERRRELGLEREVELAGHVDDVGAYLGRARLFVLPTLAEGLPYAAVEAMACGTPCLLPPVGDVSDLVEDGVCGLLVEDLADLDAVAARAAPLLDETAGWQRLSRAARARVQAGYSLAAAGEVWRRLLAELAPRSAR